MSKTRRIACISLMALLALTPLGLHLLTSLGQDNFHEVKPGYLYRSAQPSATDIARYAKLYGIRTIINLRDEERGEWYTEEHRAARDHNIQVIDYPISSDRRLPYEKSLELAELMRTAEHPVLIHCEHGSNRTGLASALYMHHVLGASDLASTLQLSPYYGHLPIPGLGRHRMFQSWLEFEDETTKHGPAS